MFEKWAEKIDDMTSRPDWEKFAIRVYFEHKRELERDTDLKLREWKQGQYFNSGLFAGQIQKVFLDEYEKAFESAQLI